MPFFGNMPNILAGDVDVSSTQRLTEIRPAATPPPEETRIQAQEGVIAVVLSNGEDIRDVFIYVNGQLWDGEVNTVPAELRMLDGSYEVEIRKDGYRSAPLSYSITVTPGEYKTLSFILLPE